MVTKPKVHKDLGHFRFRKLPDGDWVLSNEYGGWIILSPERFENLTTGKVRKNDELYKQLVEKDFIINDETVARSIEKYRMRNQFTNVGPNLHIIVVTLRCNYNCLYCHASRAPMHAKGYDMPIETAKKVVDAIFMTTNPQVNIEFQGGEPLANWETVKFIIEYAREKNRTENKDLVFSLVSNLSLMDEDKLEQLIAEDIYICTSLDGPADLHNANRPVSKGDSYANTTEWMERIDAVYKERGFDPKTYHVDALLTATKATLKAGAAVIDEYIGRGINTIHLRPLNPFGFVKKTWNKVGYTIEAYNKWYNAMLDYIIEKNLEGVQLIERQAAIGLQRVLTDDDPNYMELRSPCGAGIGQIAYNYDGKVYTCDEGRMVAQMGDDIFQMGDIAEDSYQELIESETVRTMVVASTQDAVPYCHTCAYKPYCGVCPVHNYREQGDIFGKMPSNERCKLCLSTYDHLFELLKKDDPKVKQVFERWITRRHRVVGADAMSTC